MPKIVITIEDLPNGQVKIEATPNFATLMKMDISGHSLTPAHIYGLRMLNEALKLSKVNETPHLIEIPRVRHAH